MNITPGLVLVSRDEKKNPGAWFIFYYDEGAGAAAVDLTAEHPYIPYKSFVAALGVEDIKPETEKLVLLGGPERSDDAILILHDAASSAPASARLNEEFSSISSTYKPTPGKPLILAGVGDKSGEVKLKGSSVIIVGKSPSFLQLR